MKRNRKKNYFFDLFFCCFFFSLPFRFEQCFEAVFLCSVPSSVVIVFVSETFLRRTFISGCICVLCHWNWNIFWCDKKKTLKKRWKRTQKPTEFTYGKINEQKYVHRWYEVFARVCVCVYICVYRLFCFFFLRIGIVRSILNSLCSFSTFSLSRSFSVFVRLNIILLFLFFLFVLRVSLDHLTLVDFIPSPNILIFLQWTGWYVNWLSISLVWFSSSCFVYIDTRYKSILSSSFFFLVHRLLAECVVYKTLRMFFSSFFSSSSSSYFFISFLLLSYTDCVNVFVIPCNFGILNRFRRETDENTLTQQQEEKKKQKKN